MLGGNELEGWGVAEKQLHYIYFVSNHYTYYDCGILEGVIVTVFTDLRANLHYSYNFKFFLTSLQLQENCPQFLQVQLHDLF